jgi:formylglycine-generating enzyme required for sulfatase activity
MSPDTFAMGSLESDAGRDLEGLAWIWRGFAHIFLQYERPQHTVTINQPFAVGKYPVTRGEFAAFVRATGYSADGPCTLHVNNRYRVYPGSSWQNPGFVQTDRDPVVCVSWKDAQAYLAWLNDKFNGASPKNETGPYRLPSEAEWEYAARAGTQTARWRGNASGSGNADCDGCGSPSDRKETAPVGSFHANPFGLYDVLGNVRQWTEDCWHKDYVDAPTDGSAWIAEKCDERVWRGSDWGSLPWISRSATRTKNKSSSRSNDVGFRIAKTLPSAYEKRDD